MHTNYYNMKDIKVIDFEMDDLTIATTITLNGVVVNFNILRKKYEKWLKDSDMLGWELNYSDYTGEHIQHTGTYTIEEYWKVLRDNIIKEDLKNYIMHKIY